MNMRRIGILLATYFGLMTLTAGRVSAQTQLSFSADPLPAFHTKVNLILSAKTARPGDTIWAGVQLHMDPDWHTYWKNPGAAGQATEIKWELPPGITAGEIQWPLPEKMSAGGIAFYGYANETMLLVPLKIQTNFAAGEVNLKAEVAWLECKEACVPGHAEVESKLEIGNEASASDQASVIDAAKSKIPRTDNMFSFQAWWEKIMDEKNRSLIVEGRQTDIGIRPVDNADFFPDSNDQYEIQPDTERLESKSGFRLRKALKKYEGNWPREISGLIIIESNGQRSGFEVMLPMAEQAPTFAATGNTSRLPDLTWKMLLYAFIGGLILNIMPCVLPVIALKILGFVSEAKSSPRRVRALGGIYAVGVLTSFLVLASIVIGLQAAGKQAGWGTQFGNPVFLVCLTTLVTLVALNLFGVFEITIGGSTMNVAGELAAKHGAAGAFFNGVLATVLATPCTAPFLSIALGFAFGQSAAMIVVIFLTVGIGLATPYVVLCWNPGWLRFLPKPGAWMEKFKIAMGFPMLVTAVWLFNLAAGSYGKHVLWLGIFLVLLAFAAWWFGEFFQRGRKRRGLALMVTLILLIGSYAYALEYQLRWREPVEENIAHGSLQDSPDGINWQRWSPEAVAQARREGRPVLVDFTADWCITCLANKATSLEIPSVRAKLKELNAVALLADYTHTPANILSELKHYGRPSVPLVLVFPKDTNAPPIILPEVLTPNMVLNALNQAAH